MKEDLGYAETTVNLDDDRLRLHRPGRTRSRDRSVARNGNTVPAASAGHRRQQGGRRFAQQYGCGRAVETKEDQAVRQAVRRTGWVR